VSPANDNSTTDAYREAAREASREADAWAATAKAQEVKAEADAKTEAAAESPPADVAPPVASTPTLKVQIPSAPAVPDQAPPPTAPAVVPAAVPAPPALPAPRTDLNEMNGKLQSLGDQPPVFRLLANGQYNVEFTYSDQTIVRSGQTPLKIGDLQPGDDVTVRYAGRELNAVEIERRPSAKPVP
jgi:hypothetical protein